MRSRPRQEEVRSCYIPVISAGLGFHGSMDGMNLFVAGFPDACSSMGPQGGHP